MSSHAQIAVSIKTCHRHFEIASEHLELERVFFGEHGLDAFKLYLDGLPANIKIKCSVFLKGIAAANLVSNPQGYIARDLACFFSPTQPGWTA